jgi:hypothetical protein
MKVLTVCHNAWLSSTNLLADECALYAERSASRLTEIHIARINGNVQV